jgi:hypothetical protein
VTRQEYFELVCRGMGWAPTDKRLRAFIAWSRAEDGGERLLTTAKNPLATTWYFNNYPPLDMSYNQGYGPGNWNWVPVRVYLNYHAGVEATVLTLKQPQYYKKIREMFETERYVEGVASDFSVWSGSGYSQSLANTMKTIFDEPAKPAPVPEPDIDLNTALIMRFDIAALAFGDFDTMVKVHKWLQKGGSVPERKAA